MVNPTAANGTFVKGYFALVQSQVEPHVSVLGGVILAVTEFLKDKKCPGS